MTLTTQNRQPSAAPLPGGEPELRLAPAEFERVRKLIRERAGINLGDAKQAMVYSRLARRVRERGHESFGQYLTMLESGGSDSEWQQFVNSLTTNLTAFFREEHHFHALADDLRARAAQAAARPLRIWCNAASTGEEPYSLAMTVVETLGASARAQIVCTDIDTEVLATARRGVYGADARGLSPERLKRHFLRGTGSNAGAIRVKPELARLCEFASFNLMSRDASALGEPFELVFCRNVMIYFERATQRRVLELMHRAMRPGGLLYVGHSENFSDARDLFRLRGQTIYEKV